MRELVEKRDFSRMVAELRIKARSLKRLKHPEAGKILALASALAKGDVRTARRWFRSLSDTLKRPRELPRGLIPAVVGGFREENCCDCAVCPKADCERRTDSFEGELDEADSFLQHCVAKVGKKVGTSSAFAICTAQGQKSGYYKPGSKQLTKKGQKMAKSKAQDPDHKKKKETYKVVIGKADEAWDPGGTPPGGWSDDDLVPGYQKMSQSAKRRAMEFGTPKRSRKAAQKKPRKDKRKVTIRHHASKDARPWTFDVRWGDTVKVFISRRKFPEMTVVGLSAAMKRVRVGQIGSTKGSDGYWVDFAYVYPKDYPSAKYENASHQPLGEIEEGTMKKRTFKTARAEILQFLAKKDWTVNAKLKVPHATTPHGDFRLWFKAQAVYSEPGPKPFKLGNAHTLSYDLDIREHSPEQFYKLLRRWYPETFKFLEETECVPIAEALTGPSLWWDEESLLTERQKGPTVGSMDDEPLVRPGAFKVSRNFDASVRGMFGGKWEQLLFQKQRDHINKIPRQELPKVFGLDNLPDAQDFLANRPRKAFHSWMRNVGKVSAGVAKALRNTPQNIPLWWYMFMLRIAGRDMANSLLKRYWSTNQAFKPRKTTKKQQSRNTKINKKQNKTKKKMEPFYKNWGVTESLWWDAEPDRLHESNSPKEFEDFLKKAFPDASFPG